MRRADADRGFDLSIFVSQGRIDSAQKGPHWVAICSHVGAKFVPLCGTGSSLPARWAARLRLCIHIQNVLRDGVTRSEHGRIHPYGVRIDDTGTGVEQHHQIR